MRKFALVTDTTADLSAEYMDRREIGHLRIGYRLGEDVYNADGGEGEVANLTSGEFYAKLRSGAMPTTFQVTPDAAYIFFERYLKEGKDVLYLAFSSALSGTYDSCSLAAKRLGEAYPDRKVLVLDTLSASLGEGLLVHFAADKADAGADIDETYAYALDLRDRICHYFTVDSLFHLHRGGRVSKATAIIGSLLSIKPVLHVDEGGRLVPCGKARGRRRALEALADAMERKAAGVKNPVVFISHGDCLADAEYVRDLVRAKTGAENFVLGDIGPVVGSHSGAGTVALFFLGGDRAE